jgi:hypothetical protein
MRTGNPFWSGRRPDRSGDPLRIPPVIVLACLVLVPSRDGRTEPWNRTPTCYLRRSMVVRIHSEDRLTVREEDEVWIASESDRAEGHDSFTETAYSEFKKFEGAVFDSSGRLIRKLRGDDQNQSTVTRDAVYAEHKTRFHTLGIPKIPYLVRRAKEYEMTSLIAWPDWEPQKDVAVREAVLEVIPERAVPFKFKNIGPVNGPDSTAGENGFFRFVWRAFGIPAFKPEYRAAPECLFQTGVRFYPQRFILEGNEGSAETWIRFGDWIESLFRPRLSLQTAVPEAGECRALKDPADRVRRLYRTLQNRTRYVLIHSGIDGLRPHPVEEIHRNRYGDCKDLSLYMIALLSQAGVTAYPALVLTRDEGLMDPLMPDGRFNHCVACVPAETDTFWLECTSPAGSADDVPPHLEGAYALIVKPGESILTRIAESLSNVNSRSVVAKAQLTQDRKLAVSGTVRYFGDCAYETRRSWRLLDDPSRRESFGRTLLQEAGTLSFSRFHVNGLTDPDSALSADFVFQIPFFARNAGGRWVLAPRLFNRFQFDGEAPDQRKLPLRNSGRFTDTDSVRFILPAGMTVRSGSDGTNLDSPFGFYEDRCRTTEDGFVWTSRFRLERLDVPLPDYPAYHRFMKSVKSAAGRNMVVSAEGSRTPAVP